MCENNNQKIVYVGTIYSPNGKPVPEVLTEEEAVRFLRIDTTGVKKTNLTLRYYREQGFLQATQIGKKLFYTKQALLHFLAKQTEWSNRNAG